MKRVIALVGVFTVASVLLFADSTNNSRIYTPGPGIIKIENNVLTADPTEAIVELGKSISYRVDVPSGRTWSVTIKGTNSASANGVTISPPSGTGPGGIDISADRESQPGTCTVVFTLDNSSDIENNPVEINVTIVQGDILE